MFDKLGQLRQRERSRAWIAISVAVHFLVIGAALLHRPTRVAPTIRYIELGEPRDELPAYRGPGEGTASPRGRRSTPPPVTVAPPAPVAEVVPPAPSAAVEPEAVREADTLPLGTHRRLGPEYGDGRVWVRLEDLARGDLPARRQARDVPTHVARVDSALAEKIRSYLDTVPPDSFATRAAPKWTTEIAGKTWGIDGRWIHLGGIKIPTAVLALLPLPGGNYDAAMRAEQLQRMRQDIMEAAGRAANAAEFKKYVKELRERKEQERRGRETPPVAQADSTPKPPPLIP
ncbi:MAG: hypothetical protein HY560_05080 [Gemmatimonadetes bacterium]|nr:hypothetical protein [Gemmatimonadota bacterium]